MMLSSIKTKSSLNGIKHGIFYYSTTEVPVNIPEPRVSSKNLTQFKKGPGGRSSFSGNVITVFGANGFVGKPLIDRLAKHGNQLIIPYRCDPYYIRDLKVSGDLGQILFFPFNLKDDDAIRRALKYSNMVINLIGTRIETHHHGARRIARIAKEMSVSRMIHVGDVVKGIAKIVQDPSVDGKTFQFVGPHCYKLAELIDFIYAKARCNPQLGYNLHRHGHIDPYFWLTLKACHIYAKVTQRDIYLNQEWMEYVECTSDVLSNAPTLKDLGINRLVEFENTGGFLANLYSYVRSYEERYGEFEEPPLPLRSPPLFKHTQQEFPPTEIETSTKPFGLASFRN